MCVCVFKVYFIHIWMVFPFICHKLVASRWARCSPWWVQWSELWPGATTRTRWPSWPSRRARSRYRISHSLTTNFQNIHTLIQIRIHIHWLMKHWHRHNPMICLGDQPGGHLGRGPHHLNEPEVVPRLRLLRRRIGGARIQEFQNQHILPELFLLWFKAPPARLEQSPHHIRVSSYPEFLNKLKLVAFYIL